MRVNNKYYISYEEISSTNTEIDDAFDIIFLIIEQEINRGVTGQDQVQSPLKV